MKSVTLKNNTASFLTAALIIYLLYTVFLIFSGYFEIGLLADDYLNFAGAKGSTIIQKFTGSIPYISNLHFRPLYYLSLNFSMWINELLNSAKDNFIFFRIENLMYFYVLIFLSSFLLFKITKKIYAGIFLLLMGLLYPNNLNDICWTVGRNDLQCGIFLIASLLFAFHYLENKIKYNYYLAGLFFFLGLLTKETSVMLPFLTILLVYLAYGKEKVFELKNLLGLEVFLLLIYTTFRIYILGTQPAEVITKFQRPGFFSSLNVSIKAFISLIIPYDYLSIQNNIIESNLEFIFYIILIMIFFVGVIFIFVRTNNFKYIILLSLIFLVSISPNLTAGYFRPQLALMPFLFISFSLMLVSWRMNVNLKFYAVTLLLILFFWGGISYGLIQDWNLAYNQSVNAIRTLIKTDINPQKRNIIIGLPSRFNQAYMLDYVSGAYNYWKHGEYIIKDNLSDLVLTGALDDASLSSDIKIIKYSGNEFEFSASGKTQYFLRVDAAGNRYKDKDITFSLSEKNLFRKPTVLGLRMKTDSVDVYALSGDEFIKLNE